MPTIKYFGEIAEKTGVSSENFNVEEHSIAAIVDKLQKKYDFKEGEFKIAVNHTLVEQHSAIEIQESDEIALLSAFAGG
ncbi:MAG: MoaD/ThiS family protein [Leeuwenhoekiella sp.]